MCVLHTPEIREKKPGPEAKALSEDWRDLCTDSRWGAKHRHLLLLASLASSYQTERGGGGCLLQSLCSMCQACVDSSCCLMESQMALKA